MGDALAHGAVGLAGIDAVEVLAVHRAVVNGAAEKRRHVGDVDEDDRAGEFHRVELLLHPLQRDDGGVFIAVRAGNQRQDRPVVDTLRDGDGNSSSFVHPVRYLQKTGNHFARLRRDFTDGERASLLRGCLPGKTQGECQQE